MDNANNSQMASENSEIPRDCQIARISKVRNVISQCFAVLAFNIIKFSSGNFIGFTTLLLSELNENNQNAEIHVTKDDLSWFASYCFSSPVGAIVIGVVAHLVGSRSTLLVGSLLFSMSWVMFRLAEDTAMLLIAQAIVGINISIALGPGVAYVIEITQSNLRSTFMATTNLSMILGTFFTVLLSNWLHWRTITLVNLSFSIIGMVAMFFVPESPHWLASKGRYNEAERSLAWLRGWAKPSDVQTEFRELKESQQQAYSLDSLSRLSRERRLGDVFQPYLQRSFILPLASVCLMFVMYNLAGSHTVQAFAMRIFERLDAPIDKKVASTIFDGLRIAGAVVCISCVHLLGRRKLMFFSLSAGAFSYAVVALSIHLTSNKYVQDKIYLWVPPVMIIVSTFVFAAGIDKVVNMLNGELFPSRFRNVGTGIGSFFSAIFATVMQKMFIYMMDSMTLQGVFLFLAIASALGFVVLYKVIPETEGRTLMEIEEHYARVQGLNDCAVIRKTSRTERNYSVHAVA